MTYRARTQQVATAGGPGLVPSYASSAWTPADGSGANLTFSTAVGRYMKIGSTVFLFFEIVYPLTVSVLTATISGIPFARGADVSPACAVNSNASVPVAAYLTGASALRFENFSTTANLTNAQLSTIQLDACLIYTTL